MYGYYKADLHVHSRYSNKPSMWALRKFNCPESFTRPEHIYNTARARGMDYVTISDHNSIEGALEIAHYPEVFISSEITTYLPDNGCKLHVVALGIDEPAFAEIMHLRKDLYELAGFLRQRNIAHFVAHLLYDLNGKLTVEVIEKLLLLFDVFEVRNGSRSGKYNLLAANLICSLNEGRMGQLARKHGIAPAGECPWRKGMVAGSDDHSGFYVGRAYTEARCGAGLKEFLEAVRKSETRPAGSHGDAHTLAHSIYGVGYGFWKERFSQKKWKSLPFISALMGRVCNPQNSKMSLMEKIDFFFRKNLPEVFDDSYEGRSFESILDTEARRLLCDSRFLGSLGTAGLDGRIFAVTSRLVNRLIYIYTRRLAKNWPPYDLIELFNAVCTIGFVHALAAPYYLAFHYQHRSKELMNELRARFNLKENSPRKIALFTDTLHDINGVAITIKRMIGAARSRGIDLVVITSGPGETGFREGVMNFRSTGELALPEYPDMKLHFPPLLEVMDYIETEGFTHFHASTPGTMGLLALLLNKLMDIPLSGTYHTDIPQYVKSLTNDNFLEDAAWQYMIWFYNLMDEVMVPSASTRQQLLDRGLDPSKARPLPRWVDTGMFSPDKRNIDIWRSYGVEGPLKKLLYVGRISREKNLELLAGAFRELIDAGHKASLAITGDGPFRKEMETMLAGYPAVFTGFKTGEELCVLYASSDVFVFPSATDTFGNVVLEAQASGLPVIVTDSGGPRELIVAGETGIVVEAGNSGSLVAAMRYFIENPSLSRSMGAKARLFAESGGIKPDEYYETILKGPEAA